MSRQNYLCLLTGLHFTCDADSNCPTSIISPGACHTEFPRPTVGLGMLGRGAATIGTMTDGKLME